MIYNDTKGLIAAPYSPLDKFGEIQLETISYYAKYLKDRGVGGVFVNGSTGETSSLLAQEKMQIAEEWLKYQDDGFKVFVHVGSNSVEEAKLLAEHAQKFKAQAIAATGPSYFKPGKVEDLVEIMRVIASSAPETAFYYYHIPALNQNYLSAKAFLEMAIVKIPTLSGMKYTFEDLMEFQLCRQIADGKLDIMYGRDETLICGLALGVKGAVGSTYNFMPQLYQELIDSFNKGNLHQANILQLKSMKIIEQYSKFRGIPAGKSIMKRLGIDLGVPRLPFFALTVSEEQELYNELDNLGFSG